MACVAYLSIIAPSLLFMLPLSLLSVDGRFVGEMFEAAALIASLSKSTGLDGDADIIHIGQAMKRI